MTLAAAALLGGVAACVDVAEKTTAPPDLAAMPVAAMESPGGIGGAAARSLTFATGKPHTVEDIRHMGVHAAFNTLSRHWLQRDERELADLRAKQPEQGSHEAERIEELESRIRNRLLFLAKDGQDTGLLADGSENDQQEDEEFCRDKPVIDYAETTQDITRSERIPRVTIRARGMHTTSEDQMHSLGTVINVIDQRTNQAVESVLDSGLDRRCRTRHSPYTWVSLRISTDREDFEHLCAESWSSHRATNRDGKSAFATSPEFPTCEDLGDREPGIQILRPH